MSSAKMPRQVGTAHRYPDSVSSCVTIARDRFLRSCGTLLAFPLSIVPSPPSQSRGQQLARAFAGGLHSLSEPIPWQAEEGRRTPVSTTGARKACLEAPHGRAARPGLLGG